MNNQAFRKLVHQHTSGSNNKLGGGGKKNRGQSAFKTSKEIARDVVEQEFNEIKKKRKKKGDFDGDFNASDDDDDDYDNKLKRDSKADKEEEDDNKKGNQDRRKRKRGNQKNDDDENAKNKYRDRAKERREGKNVDYQATEGMYIPQGEDGVEKAKEMSKYLGGDESYTHLVKGLDKSLADKVRREVRGHQGKDKNDVDIDNLDLDEVMEEAKAQKARKKIKSEKKDPIDATIREKKSSKIPCVSSMARYIENVTKKQLSGEVVSGFAPNNDSSTAVQSLHRSMLTFSLKQNHHDLREYGWELPKVSIAAMNGRLVNNSDTVSPSCTPLDRNLILKIKSVMKAANESKRKLRLFRQESTSLRSEEHENENDQEQNTSKQLTSKDDSDDDIYGDIGDYI